MATKQKVTRSDITKALLNWVLGLHRASLRKKIVAADAKVIAARYAVQNQRRVIENETLHLSNLQDTYSLESAKAGEIRRAASKELTALPTKY